MKDNRAYYLLDEFSVLTSMQIIFLRKQKYIKNLSDREVILHENHILPTAGHAGMNKTYKKLKRFYYWPTMLQDVKEMVTNCNKCQRMKYHNTIKPQMQVTTTAESAFGKIYIVSTNYTPFELVYGRLCRLPTSIFPREKRDYDETILSNN